ncbi:MAG: 3D domain-containing protein [Pyrinomonadaceae bacterium]
MKNLVRGCVVLLLTSTFVAIIFAQTNTDKATIIANESQPKFENNISNNLLVIPSDDEKKLVKTTALVTAKAAGASRGSFSATAYCLSGKTAMGYGVRRGIIAADPRVLKLGSKVTVTAGNWSGTYLVSDTGGAIKGKKIDIWVPSCSEARKFGRRSVQIFSAQ